MVVWAPVGESSILVSDSFVYQNNGCANAYSNSTEEFEIYTPDHPKSNVWLYFEFLKEQGKIK